MLIKQIHLLENMKQSFKYSYPGLQLLKEVTSSKVTCNPFLQIFEVISLILFPRRIIRMAKLHIMTSAIGPS